MRPKRRVGRGWPHLGAAPGILWLVEEPAQRPSGRTLAGLVFDTGSFLDAFTGISGLQFTLPATWSEAAQHGATLSNLSKVSSTT